MLTHLKHVYRIVIEIMLTYLSVTSWSDKVKPMLLGYLLYFSCQLKKRKAFLTPQLANQAKAACVYAVSTRK